MSHIEQLIYIKCFTSGIGLVLKTWTCKSQNQSVLSYVDTIVMYTKVDSSKTKCNRDITLLLAVDSPVDNVKGHLVTLNVKILDVLKDFDKRQAHNFLFFLLSSARGSDWENREGPDFL